MSKSKKPAEKLAEIPKDVKNALKKLEAEVGNTLGELEKLRPVEEAAKSASAVREAFEDRTKQLHSLMDKYIADVHITGDFKSDFKRLSNQLPELSSRLRESIEKKVASIYTDRIKVFGGDVKSSLSRLRQKIGY